MKINPKSRESFQKLALELSENRPSVGRRVKVIKGRKHKGKTGEVLVHKVDEFSDSFRYCDSSQMFIKECEGRDGYIVLVKPLNNGNSFWVKASYVELI